MFGEMILNRSNTVHFRWERQHRAPAVRWPGPSAVRYTHRVMLPRRFDRYLVRETVGPFLLALAGLVLFILLNVILSLSYLMVDRGISLMTFLRLVLYRVPAVLVLAVPMAALFATFLGLGRLGHDREIMAFESIGIPLRRMLLPLLIAAAFVAGLDFALYNWGVPAAEAAFQSELRGIIFSQGAPRITANEFFKGPEDQFFYVRRYDTDDGTMQDVFIYDISGRVFPQADTNVTILSAQDGRWADPMLELSGGRIYGFNLDGELVYSGEFETLSIPMEQSIEQVFARSKTASEMGIAELLDRIAAARRSAQSTNEYIVELHLKLSLPLTTIIFVLLGGSISLIFGTRSRAIGIVISLALVGIFQGLLFLTQTFGQRGAMNPALAPWIPNIVFTILGLLLFLWIDRLASRNLWNQMRRRLPHLGLLLLLLFTIPARSQEAPLDLRADELFVSADQTTFAASGSVTAVYEEIRLRADAVDLEKVDGQRWRIEARGDAELAVGEDLFISGDTVHAEIEVTGAGTRTTTLAADGFSGHSVFTNSADEEHTIWFRGETGRITFDDAGEAELIEVERGALSTCNCCGLPLDGQPYSLHARRMQLYPDRLIVVFGLTARIAGVSSFWLPVYVQPLEETLESPLFPAIGRSALRGWFVKWNVPFYLSESLFGSVLFDYYAGTEELGAGFVAHYAFAGHAGRVRAYSFPAKVGDSIFELSASHDLPSSGIWCGSARADYSISGSTVKLDYGAEIAGSSAGWNVIITASREIEEEQGQGSDVKITERVPDLEMTRAPWSLGSLSIRPQLDAGLLRETIGDEPRVAATRLRGGFDLSMRELAWLGVNFMPSLELRKTVYVGSRTEQTLGTLYAEVDAEWRGIEATYEVRLVQGQSPFEFDKEKTKHRIDWTLKSHGWGTLTIGGGIDFEGAALDPLSLRLEWSDWAKWTLSTRYRLEEASFGTVTLGAAWSTDALDIAWKIPFDPADATFGPLDLSVDASDERLDLSLDASLEEARLHLESAIAASLSLGPLAVQGTLALEDLEISKLEFDATLRAAGGWGATAGWAYKGGTRTLGSLRYGVFRDLGDCLRIGVERESSDTWVYVSILAFPEAVLRYAPRTSGIQVGE